MCIRRDGTGRDGARWGGDTERRAQGGVKPRLFCRAAKQASRPRFLARSLPFASREGGRWWLAAAARGRRRGAGCAGRRAVLTRSARAHRGGARHAPRARAGNGERASERQPSEPRQQPQLTSCSPRSCARAAQGASAASLMDGRGLALGHAQAFWGARTQPALSRSASCQPRACPGTSAGGGGGRRVSAHAGQRRGDEGKGQLSLQAPDAQTVGPHRGRRAARRTHGARLAAARRSGEAGRRGAGAVRRSLAQGRALQGRPCGGCRCSAAAPRAGLARRAPRRGAWQGRARGVATRLLGLLVNLRPASTELLANLAEGDARVLRAHHRPHVLHAHHVARASARRRSRAPARRGGRTVGQCPHNDASRGRGGARGGPRPAGQTQCGPARPSASRQHELTPWRRTCRRPAHASARWDPWAPSPSSA